MTSRSTGVRSLPGWLPCPDCEGTGQMTLIIEERVVECVHCHGHGAYPGLKAADGPYWFYHPLARHSEKMGGSLIAGSDRIGYLQRVEGDEWEWEYFDRKGPCGGVERMAQVIVVELAGYQYRPSAAMLLDEWSKRPLWRRGVRYLVYRGYDDLLRYHGYSDEVFEVRKAVRGDLERAIRELAQLKAKLLPDACIFG